MDSNGQEFSGWTRTVLGTIIVPFTEKVFGDHNYEVLTSSRNGIQRQSEHFAGKQRHDTDGYNIIPRGYCTYRNRSDDGLFTFNMNNIVDEGIVSKFYPVFTFQNANSTFMMEYLNGSPRVRAKLSVLAVGTSQVVLSFETLKETSFYLPIFEEQNRIASLLSALNARIEKQRLLIEHLKKYKRGVSIAIFDRKISLTKNSPSWIKTTIGEICKITMGQSPDSESYNTDQIGIPLVQGNADMKNRITCPQRYTSKPTKICEKGSIILSVRAPVGSVGRADRTVCLGRGVCAINSDNNDFLYYFFERNEPYWKRIEQGGTFTAISGDDIADMPIDYPSLEERQKIADFLLKIDTHIAAEQNTLDQFITLKSGLLQQLFT